MGPTCLPLCILLPRAHMPITATRRARRFHCNAIRRPRSGRCAALQLRHPSALLRLSCRPPALPAPSAGPALSAMPRSRQHSSRHRAIRWPRSGRGAVLPPAPLAPPRCAPSAGPSPAAAPRSAGLARVAAPRAVRRLRSSRSAALPPAVLVPPRCPPAGPARAACHPPALLRTPRPRRAALLPAHARTAAPGGATHQLARTGFRRRKRHSTGVEVGSFDPFILEKSNQPASRGYILLDIGIRLAPQLQPE
ncbi:atherin-like isoform X1 [Panicum hallii]|uniref:atherin-like isoform X1 n=1 Tax=Panicum hallii TaxID=206008 RepID=UPI000DF4CDA8|nr:atherin-like isoform X1 [Panicum hallii]